MSIITSDVKEAMDILYKKYLRASQRNNIKDLEAIDLALDELTRNHNRVGLPHVLAEYAMKSAFKKLKWRAKYRQEFDEDDFACDAISNPKYSCTDEIEHKVIEVRDFIKKAPIKENYKEVLGYLEMGLEAEEIAEIKCVAKSQAQVWITRARKKIRSAWEVAS